MQVAAAARARRRLPSCFRIAGSGLKRWLWLRLLVQHELAILAFPQPLQVDLCLVQVGQLRSDRIGLLRGQDQPASIKYNLSLLGIVLSRQQHSV